MLAPVCAAPTTSVGLLYVRPMSVERICWLVRPAVPSPSNCSTTVFVAASHTAVFCPASFTSTLSCPQLPPLSVDRRVQTSRGPELLKPMGLQPSPMEWRHSANASSTPGAGRMMLGMRTQG